MEERQARSSHNMLYSVRNTVLIAKHCLPTFQRQIVLFSGGCPLVVVMFRHLVLLIAYLGKVYDIDNPLGTC